MKKTNSYLMSAFIVSLSLGSMETASAAAVVQCPGDINNDAIVDVPVYKKDLNGNFIIDPVNGDPSNGFKVPRQVNCKHISGGDGFATMADGKVLYTLGFGELTGIPQEQAIEHNITGAELPAPKIIMDEGDEFYLTLTNVGMSMRPDLFDPHTVHFHGFPNAASIFDGVPDDSISINMLSSLTYYYNVVEPGTYLYHCHVEAAEHMQMGMIGNLYVRPRQNKTGCANGSCPVAQLGGNPDLTAPKGYTYNDGDGATAYDVEMPIQITSLDPVFHDAHINVQPLRFADMKDSYPLINGRGYPDTVNPAVLAGPAENGNKNVQKETSVINATVGQKILLRASNVSITRFFTFSTMGLKMKVVGLGAKLLRGPDPASGKLYDYHGADLSYDTSSVTLGGGESADIIIDTTNVSPGKYFLYTTNLNYLSNDVEDFGGIMTEININ